MEIVAFDEVDVFIKHQNSSAKAKIVRKLGLLKVYGNEIGLPHSKKVAPHLFELRITGSTQIRIFYCFYSKKIYLLHAFTKKDQKIPHAELATALKALSKLRTT